MSGRTLEWKVSVLGSAMALAIALAAGHLLILACGESPARVFWALFEGTWGTAYGIGQVLFKATPLLLTGLAVALPFRAGLFNIGAEGQATLGALATALVGLALPEWLPAVVAVPVAASAGFLVGGAWAALPAVLRVRFRAHEVISTILLNFVALSLANFLVAAYFALPETLHTAAIPESARLARFGAIFPALHGSAANLSLVFALGLAAYLAWLLFRTRIGYEIRAVGLNPRAAQAGGISLLKTSVVSMAIGGGCAGLVGMNFVQGYKYYFEEGFAGGVGFMGIAVALLGRNHPLWLVPAALVFGTLSQGGLAINALVPKELVEVLQAVIILAVVASTSEVRDILSRQRGGA